MDFALFLVLFAAGTASGIINAIAGGGTFITFGALTLFGLPPISANASSSVIQLPGYITSAMSYRDEFRGIWRRALALLAIAVIGALLGSLVLISLDNPEFSTLVPWLLLAATAVFALGPSINRLQDKMRRRQTASNALGYVLQFLTAIYGGFFGAGMGILLLATLGMTESRDYHRTNALKNLISVLIAIVAIVVFTTGGIISWREVFFMAPGAALGGFLGVWVARRVPQQIMRIVVIAIGLGLAVYYFRTS